jgi:hypothetical protein
MGDKGAAEVRVTRTLAERQHRFPATSLRWPDRLQGQ